MINSKGFGRKRSDIIEVLSRRRAEEDHENLNQDNRYLDRDRNQYL
jgi:hypothetical protein